MIIDILWLPRPLGIFASNHIWKQPYVVRQFLLGSVVPMRVTELKEIVVGSLVNLTTYTVDVNGPGYGKMSLPNFEVISTTYCSGYTPWKRFSTLCNFHVVKAIIKISFVYCEKLELYKKFSHQRQRYSIPLPLNTFNSLVSSYRTCIFVVLVQLVSPPVVLLFVSGWKFKIIVLLILVLDFYNCILNGLKTFRRVILSKALALDTH